MHDNFPTPEAAEEHAAELARSIFTLTMIGAVAFTYACYAVMFAH